MPASRRLGFCQFFLPAAALFLASCAVPLGPGYSIKKQSLDVHYFAGDPPRLEIRARYKLKNTGNRSLAALEVGLPGEKCYGRKNLRATLDGAEAVTSAVPKANVALQDDTASISFPRPWTQKEEHDLAIEYELTEPYAPAVGIVMASDSFFLSSAPWYPVLHPPDGLFGKGDDRQKPLELSIFVPQGFLAHSSGRARGVRKENSELIYRFQIAKEDFDPFVVAGRYHEQRFQNAGTILVFWRLQAPPAPEKFERGGRYLAGAIAVFENDFGPLWKKPQPFRVVEMHLLPPGEETSTSRTVSSSRDFPGGAVFETSELEDPVKSVEYSLADNWFGLLTHPAAGDSDSLRNAFTVYAVLVAAEARGESSKRVEQIKANMFAFDSALKQAGKEKLLLSLSRSDPASQHTLGVLKTQLLLAASKDRCGEESLHRAIRHLVQSLRGSTYGYNELRSALEQECHQDLGPMFRQWLTETGIPSDFRQRYEAKP